MTAEPTSAPPVSLKSFEEGLQNLEQLVRQLEAGELSLEDSLASFEQGVALVRTLNQRLATAEQRVELLTRSAGGELVTAAAPEDLERRS